MYLINVIVLRIRYSVRTCRISISTSTSTALEYTLMITIITIIFMYIADGEYAIQCGYIANPLLSHFWLSRERIRVPSCGLRPIEWNSQRISHPFYQFSFIFINFLSHHSHYHIGSVDREGPYRLPDQIPYVAQLSPFLFRAHRRFFFNN